jgi:hypothetical protein
MPANTMPAAAILRGRCSFSSFEERSAPTRNGKDAESAIMNFMARGRVTYRGGALRS